MSGQDNQTTKLPPLTVVYVRWRDAMHSMNDHPISALGELAELHEIGFLLKETAEVIVLGTESEANQIEARMWITIPKANIVDIRRTTLTKAFPLPRKRKEQLAKDRSGHI